MGISMCIIAVGDDEIGRALVEETLADDLCTSVVTNYSGRIHTLVWDAWRELDYLLGGSSPLTVGDVILTRERGDEIHAIYSGNVKRVAAAWRELSDDVARARFADQDAIAKGDVWISHDLSELLGYLEKLRRLADHAAGADQGLLFGRYEDL